jgi:metal-responsive CopG/Arc/MetJ family transcriptional regulator
MNSLEQLEKQQVGLRLPKYLVDDIDEFTKHFALNRTDIIIEAIKSYIQVQKENLFYDSFDSSCKELAESLKNRDKKNLKTLDGLIDELENS